MAKSQREDDLNPDEVDELDEFGDKIEKTAAGTPADIPGDASNLDEDLEGPSDPEQAEIDDPDPDLFGDPDEQKLPMIVEVLTDENDPGKLGGRQRRVIRRECRPLNMEERLAVDDEIVKSNGEMRKLETEKAATVKKYNGEIAEQRQILDDAIQVLRKDRVDYDIERMMRINEDDWVYTFHDIETDEVVDTEDIPEEKRQTNMKF
jgi:hypothetical protein